MKTRRRRYQLWLDFDKKCAYCGEEIPYEEITIDHMIPKSRGGGKIKGNFVPACRPCNSRKGDKYLLKGEMRWHNE